MWDKIWCGLSKVVQDFVAQDYHLLSSGLTTNLCLVQRVRVLRTSPRPPSLNLHSLALMQLASHAKQRVEPSPTFRLATPEATTKVTPQWSKLGSPLNESSHLKVHLERHVNNLPHTYTHAIVCSPHTHTSNIVTSLCYYHVILKYWPWSIVFFCSERSLSIIVAKISKYKLWTCLYFLVCI
jgi:hypothetical protein